MMTTFVNDITMQDASQTSEKVRGEIECESSAGNYLKKIKEDFWIHFLVEFVTT